MYNRYIPQPDGSHRRKSMEEPRRTFSPSKPPKQHQTHSAPPEPTPCPPPEPPKRHPEPAVCPMQGQRNGIGSFFRQLLPKELDTGDLLILLLLLLMAGDCEEDRNNALLTMALYFLM